MPIVAVSCPKCGAPLKAPQLGATIECGSCGATLEVREGSYGYPLASIKAISNDTSFIAKRAAAARLRELLDELIEEEKLIYNKISSVEKNFDGGCAYSIATIAWAPALLGIFMLLFGGDGAAYGLLLLLGSASAVGIPYVIAKTSHDDKVSKLRDQHKTRLNELKAEIVDRSGQLTTLEKELDKLTKAMQ